MLAVTIALLLEMPQPYWAVTTVYIVSSSPLAVVAIKSGMADRGLTRGSCHRAGCVAVILDWYEVTLIKSVVAWHAGSVFQTLQA